jgi:hypothetical protein
MAKDETPPANDLQIIILQRVLGCLATLEILLSHELGQILPG